MAGVTAPILGTTKAAHLAPVPLLVITTYTDREAQTIDEVFYISDRGVLYDYGDTGTDRAFSPMLLGISILRSSISQTPDPNATRILSQPITFHL